LERAAAAGIATRVVDVYEQDLAGQLRGCDGFMWWFAHLPEIRQTGKRVLLAIEHGMRIATFPDWSTIWHFDDKIAQTYLLDAAGVPMPPTWIFWNRTQALEFARSASYPIVLKLAGGIVSENVRLVRSEAEARFWIEQLFGSGLTQLTGWPVPGFRLRWRRRMGRAVRALLGRETAPLSRRIELQRGYVLFQQFQPDNAFDTRVTVIGDRAFAFRRFNRPDDFRASGSGRIDWNPDAINRAAVDLAIRTARRLRAQSLAVDVLHAPDGSLVINEISYYYEGWAVEACPGHWSSDGRWHAGQMAPADAIFEDFVHQIAATVAA
jgi:hypothetical protein